MLNPRVSIRSQTPTRRAIHMRPSPGSQSLLWVVFALSGLTWPHVLRAQFSAVDLTAPPACLQSISADSMVRVVVYVAADTVRHPFDHPDTMRHVNRFAMPNVAVVAQAVGEQIRTMFGAGSDTLAAGAPLVSWRALDEPIDVGAWRDGRMVARVDRDSGDTTGSTLLMHAFAAARATGVGFVWPDSTSDSVTFTLALVAPVVSRSHRVSPRLDPIQVPVFTLSVPWVEPVRLRTTSAPEYPRDAVMEGARATIFLRYVVDTTGRVEMKTVRDARDFAWLPPSMRLRDFYVQFLQAARAALVRWTFVPARVGGCPVPQQIAQSFSFGFSTVGGVPWHMEPWP